MSQSDVVDRIRQVAIVLTSVDAATARKLLGQLPEAQARQVRQRMANLGSVSPAEREAAMQAFAKLNRAMNKSAVPTASSTSAARSPAEAILSSVPETIDRFEPSNTNSIGSFDHSSSPSQPHDGFTPVQSQQQNPFSPHWSPTWQQWSGEDLARMLTNERPNVIAALVLQCPTELGSGIVQALPAPLAASVLAALPQLHTTDPFVLQEIYDQLHTKLIDFQRQTSPANAGMTKLQALMTQLNGDKKEHIQATLARTEPMLAHSLGLSIEKLAAAAPEPPRPAAELSATSSPAAAPAGNALPAADSDDDVAEMIVPFVARESTTELDETIGEPDFEELANFSQEDLAIVLRSLDPQTILLATAAAGPVMRSRVESLIDAKEVVRLRKRLHALRRVSNVEKAAAQQKIARTAGILLQQGRIAGLSSVSFVAA